MNIFKRYQKELANFSLLSAKKENELLKASNEDSRNEIITSNLRLVVSMALKHRHRGVPLEDLIQEGNLGLIAAAEKFDPSRNQRFSTYASWVILSHIRNAIRKARHAQKEVPLCLQDDEDEEFLNPCLVDNETPFEAFIRVEDKKLVQRLIDTLEKKVEREIIRERYGFDEKQFHLKEIAEKYGLAISTVDEIQKRALRKMRKQAKK